MTVALKRNVPGFRDANGVFRPIRSASYIGSGRSRRPAKAKDRKKYSRAKAGDLGKLKQERALEAPWDREYRLEQEAKAAEKREQDRIEKQIAAEVYGETSGRTSRGKARSLAQFVRSEGGINTKSKVRKGRVRYGDSLENFTRKGSGSTGLVTTTPGKGKSLDYMYQAAREAGYDVASMDDLLDALDNEIRSGKKTYSTHGYMTYNPAKLFGVVITKTDGSKEYDFHYGGEKETAASVAKVYRLMMKKAKAGQIGFQSKRDWKSVKVTAEKHTVKTNSAASDFFHEANRVYGAVFTQVNKQLHNANLAQVQDLAKKYGPRHPDQAHGITRDIVVHGKKAPAFMKIAKPNPDLLSMFANAAVGIASTLQIKEMLKTRKRPAAPKKRGTTTAKARKHNPAGKHYTVKGTKNGKRVQFFTQAATPAAAIREIEKYQGEIKNAKATIFTEKMAAAWFTARGNKMSVARSRPQSNPSQPNLFKRQPKGELYVLTIGSGDDLISVYLHDGDKDGFSKRFKTMAGAKSYATRNKVKLVENPKRNGIIKRAWARSRAASEYRRELRLEAAAERSRVRRRKAEAKAKANPARGSANYKKIFGLTATQIRNAHDISLALWNSISQAERNKLGREAAAWKKNPPRRSANGKKAVARSAKANPKAEFKIGDWVTDGSRTFQIGKRQVTYGQYEYGERDRGILKSPFRFPYGWKKVRKPNPLDLPKCRKCGRYGAIDARNRVVCVNKVCANVGGNIPRKAPARRNPKSTARRRTFEMFQGRKVTTARPMLVSNHAPANLDALGDLVELKIAGGPVLKFNGKGVKLCAAGGKLWIAGKRFAKANPAAAANEINPIGEIDHVVYGTRKPHHGDHDYTHYIHKLGEESGRRPILCVDREGFPVIRGGNYKIEARGIVD